MTLIVSTKRTGSFFKSHLNFCALNLKAFSFALKNKWLSPREYEKSYDQIAPHYDANWQKSLRPVTDHLLSQVPKIPSGKIIDLGCGTGYTTKFLSGHSPAATIAAVDLSSNMLDIAKSRIDNKNVNFVHADMLAFLNSERQNETAMILSAWAIGYSNPAKIIAQCSRCLMRNGVLAFVVNYFDTLSPIFRAYWTCLLKFPSKLQMAAWPRFPKKWSKMKRDLNKNGFNIVCHEDGYQTVFDPKSAGPIKLDWLLTTGIVAGFDQLVPLASTGELRNEFESQLNKIKEPVKHHYMMVIARKIK